MGSCFAWKVEVISCPSRTLIMVFLIAAKDGNLGATVIADFVKKKKESVDALLWIEELPLCFSAFMANDVLQL